MSHSMTGLRALEDHWKLPLPAAFQRLYRSFDYPFINPCEFLPLSDMLEDTERWRGMLPQFLPFAHDGRENFIGFYSRDDAPRGDYPVLFWDHEYDHYSPIASGFESLLRWCVISGRYEANDTYDVEDPQFAEEEEHRKEFARVVGLPVKLLLSSIPRNDFELNSALLISDPQAPKPLSRIGCSHLAKGDVERARDYFTRASEAAPWFADPYYLLAESYSVQDRGAEAAARWWKVLQCPIALSTRTSDYDLGSEHEDAEVSESAAQAYLVRARCGDAPFAADPLACWLLEARDVFESASRLKLGDLLSAREDDAGAEREYLNAVTLATAPGDLDVAYARLVAVYHRTGRMRDAELCRRDAEQA